MFSQRNRFKMLYLVMLTSGLSYSGAALASPSLNSPGAKCVPVNGEFLNVTSDGEATNVNPSGFITVICPAERTIAPTTDTAFAAVVWAINLNQGSAVCCRVVSKNAFGSIVTNPSSTCTTNFGSQFQELIIPTITDTGTFSQYFVRCTIPAATSNGVSGILGYRTIEG